MRMPHRQHQCPQIGAVGLDLSFVSHVFLMEPLEDEALEQQVGGGRGSGGCVSVRRLVCVGV